MSSNLWCVFSLHTFFIYVHTKVLLLYQQNSISYLNYKATETFPAGSAPLGVGPMEDGMEYDLSLERYISKLIREPLESEATLLPEKMPQLMANMPTHTVQQPTPEDSLYSEN